jgi:hypothetical protein
MNDNNSEKERDQNIDRDLERVKEDLKRVREAEDLVKDEKRHLVEDLEKLEIYIDGKPHVSPNPTTGEALYKLGSIDATTYDLWKEVQGKGDDILIENNDSIVHLIECERFVSAQKNLNPGA